MGKVIDIQCPSCKAPLHFDSKLQKMKCEYCDNEFSVEDLKNVEEVDYNEQTTDENVNYVNYTCPDCGAEIIADEQTAATFCLYCGNTTIIKNKLSGKFAPSKIIPFKVAKEDAVKAFLGLKKGRPFVPDDFLSNKNIDKITGLYVPFWLYNVTVDGDLIAEGYTITVGNEYTKKDYYSLEREGSIKFLKIPVDGSTRFNNDMMNSIEPFKYNELEPYNHAYLSGYLAEKYDVSEEDSTGEAMNRALNSARNYFLNDMGVYSSKVIKKDGLQTYKDSHDYVLLPVWMVNVKYKNKFYLFAMNGQTGKFIGNIPIDKKKVLIRSIIYFVIGFIVTLFVHFVLYLGGIL